MEFDQPVYLKDENSQEEEAGVLTTCEKAPHYRSDYIVMWVDKNINSGENLIYRSCFHKLNFENVKTLDNPDEYTKYIANKLTKNKVFIVTSGQFAAKVLESTSV